MKRKRPRHGYLVSLLRAEVPGDRRRGDGERPLDRRHGGVRPLAGVQQHRGDDLVVRVEQEENQEYKQADQGRKDRAGRCHQG